MQRDLLRVAVFGVSFSLPVSAAVVVAALLLTSEPDLPSAPIALPSTSSPAPQSTVTVTVEAPVPSRSARPPEPSSRPVPQGSVVLVHRSTTASDDECTRIVTVYENRSNTAVVSITQSFQTSYAPKHEEGEYPEDKDGPVKTLTQDAGIAPYATRQLTWDVCAPELTKLMNPYPEDGTGGFMSEVGAVPTKTRWKWLA
ncbi:hypothetical protein ABGB12_34170 [Actinocorallia sp. B10E7]|uniref:hypothetical protein n=1 Tax=Actinocorallia sp. B10E7 TaxID=3153558 RepID=UPI00325F8B95